MTSPDAFPETYEDAIAYLYDRINFEKQFPQVYDQQNFRLSRMKHLLELLGNPQQSAPIIHIAGSKGKGSTAWLIAESFRSAGYRTGLYTSPHLLNLEERFVIDGSPISRQSILTSICAIADAVNEVGRQGHGAATFFEITTAMAWWLFNAAKVEVQIIEVGLGGRLDSTNVCWPTLSVITSISYDHQQQLGDTLAEIATEKGGIIKPGVPVLCGPLGEEAQTAIHRIAKDRGSLVRQYGRDFYSTTGNDHKQTFDYVADQNSWPFGTSYSEMHVALLGDHQIANATVAVAAVEILREQGWKISEHHLRHAIATTRVPGRIEVVHEHNPTVIVDTAHNESSIEALLGTLKTHFSQRPLRMIFAASTDKRYQKMLQLVAPECHKLYLTEYHINPRAVTVAELNSAAGLIIEKDKLATQMAVSSNPREILQIVLAECERDDVLCVAGSFFLAAELLPQLASHSWKVEPAQTLHSSGNQAVEP